jgi:hypothetical protein
MRFIRNDFSLLPILGSPGKICDALRRILLYCHVWQIPSRTYFCDLLASVYHVYFDELWASPQSMHLPFKMRVIEAISADFLARFLSRPLIC